MRDALDVHLRHEPSKVSESRIKRLRGLSRPQYRLRVEELRAFYDVAGEEVLVVAIVAKADAEAWLAPEGQPDEEKKVPLSEVKDDLSKFLRLAEAEEVVITRHGKPAGVLIGFASEDDWFEFRLERDPRFLRRIEEARQSLQQGRGVRLEDLEGEASA